MIKKLTLILIFAISFSIPAFAKIEEGYLDYSGFPYNFKPQEARNFLAQADKNMALFEKAETNKDKDFYLQEAMKYYFMLSVVNPDSIDAAIGLGRIYDEMRRDSYAKKCFYVALNFDNSSPKANYYFAEFYFKRADYINAINYYNFALNNRYTAKYSLYLKMGTIYEKLGDLKSAIKFYKNALAFDKNNQDLQLKIQNLESLNYADSQYYLFKKK